MTALQRTPLYDVHVALGGKIVPFAGFEMPVQYPTGITAEHNAVRKACGLFDVSHMGEFIITGPQAVEFVNAVTTNNVAALEAQKAAGLTRKLVGFTTPERTFPRHGYPVFVNGAPSGEVRSGTMSPSCGGGIGTAYVPTDEAVFGKTLQVDVRGKRVTGTIVEVPFWKHGTVRR